jgi:hypothetical protein
MQAVGRGFQGFTGGMMRDQASADAGAREGYDERQATIRRMAERTAKIEDEQAMTQWKRSLPPTPSEQLGMDVQRAQLSNIQRESARADEAAARQKALYDSFTSQPAPVPDNSAPVSPDAARFAAPGLAAQEPQTPQEIFNALPPNKRAQAQMALASGDMKTFSKILGEGPDQLADTLTPGEKRVDQSFAKSYEEYVLSGGAADFDKNLSQLRGVRDQLKSGKENLTGPILGRMPDAVTSFTNPKAVDARQLVEEVVQRNLRIILGAQFTQKEGEGLIARAYNPALDEATNAKRMDRLIGSMEKMAKAKMKAMDYFEKNGTMKGYKGTTQFSANDILADLDTPEQRSGGDAQAAKGGWSIQREAD